MENNQSSRGQGLSHISRALTQQKTKAVCLDCGEPFEALDIGSHTRHYCNNCAVKRAGLEEADKLAREEAVAEERHRALISQAKMPPKWQTTTFANSKMEFNLHAFKFASQYAEVFNSLSPSLALYSPGNGTGKTHLAACIANHVLHIKRLPVLFMKARDLMLEIRRTFSDRGDITEADILDKVLSVKLLVLDDVGVDPPTRWLHATYWTVFDRRLEWQLPTVVTTNKPFEAPVGKECLADRIGDGAFSRLVELCQGNVIDMTGIDLR